MDKLTSKQEMLCQLISQGYNQSEAYKVAFGHKEITNTITINASKMVTKNTKVQQRIAELKLKLLEDSTSTLVADARERRETLSMILRKPDARDRDRISAIVELSKLESDYNQSIDTTINVVSLRSYSVDELRLMIQQAKAVDGEVIP